MIVEKKNNMIPEDFIYYRIHKDEEEKGKVSMPHRFSYKEARPVIAASVKCVECAIKKLMNGKRIRTTYGTWWAEEKHGNRT